MIATAFLSSSFHEDDAQLVDRFKRILSDLRIDPYQARGVPVLFPDIISQIESHDLFICLLTPRKYRQPPKWVSFELAAALTLKRPVIIFREDSVPIQEEYAHRNQVEFNREALLRGDATAIQAVKNTISEHCRFYGVPIRGLDPDLDRRFDFAIKQAQAVGSQILAFYNDALRKAKVRDYAVKNFPTEADRRANRMVIEAIVKDFLTKDDGIVAEESINDPKVVREQITEREFVWIIDPLDGTLNFAYGFPYFCISLGLLRAGKPVLGVIYNPTTQEMYCGREDFVSECLDLKSGLRRSLRLHSDKAALSDCVLMTHISTFAAKLSTFS
jgi:hypothetical protein